MARLSAGAPIRVARCFLHALERTKATAYQMGDADSRGTKIWAEIVRETREKFSKAIAGRFAVRFIHPNCLFAATDYLLR